MNSTNSFDITLGDKQLSFTASYTVGRPEPDVGFFKPIVEIMFGDFLSLAFDQILNNL